MPTKQPVVTMIFPEELLKRVEDYRYENRIPSRTEAIRQLLEKGLKLVFVFDGKVPDLKNAEQIADRIVNNVANHIFLFDEQRIRITISAGLAEYPKDSDQVGKLIEAADNAMYNAKKHGGNTFSL